MATTDDHQALRDFILKIMDERDLRYQQRFDAQSTAIKDALSAAEKAVTKAEVATERRFESVNEFRSTLSDQAQSFVSRVEYAAQRDSFATRISDLAARVDKAEGKGLGASATWVVLVAVGGLALAAISILVHFLK